MVRESELSCEVSGGERTRTADLLRCEPPRANFVDNNNFNHSRSQALLGDHWRPLVTTKSHSFAHGSHTNVALAAFSREDRWRVRSTIAPMDVLPSAFRHGVKEKDIEHVLKSAIVVEEVGEDPTRFLVLGPDRAGNLLEMVVMDRPNGPAVIHAMPMNARYSRLLPEKE